MALDGRIAKMGAFAFIFLACFGGLLALVPDEFAVSTNNPGSQEDKVPEVWNGQNLLQYNLTEAWNWTLTLATDEELFDVGGRNLRLHWDVFRQMQLVHRYGFGLLFDEAMDWYDRSGELVSYQLFGYATISYVGLDNDFAEYGNIQFDVVCMGQGAGSSYFKVIVLLAFNTTTYSTPGEAWNASDLDILVGIDYDDSATAMNIWYLITSLLLFNTLEVFGSTSQEAVVLNGIIITPFWACIIIFAGAVLLEILPF